jgi:hypothetical protein
MQHLGQPGGPPNPNMLASMDPEMRRAWIGQQLGGRQSLEGMNPNQMNAVSICSYPLFISLALVYCPCRLVVYASDGFSSYSLPNKETPTRRPLLPTSYTPPHPCPPSHIIPSNFLI